MFTSLGLPVLIGGAGLGVDLTQWYMWKRELQFAVDQAAIAGAWARADSSTEHSYITRAQQEFTANVSITSDFSTAPTVELAGYGGALNNSVVVTATAGKALPFTNFLTGQTATITAFAQASFEEGVTFTSCLIAIDDDDYGAITIGGNSVLTASCGMAALSTDETAITVNGNPTVDAGWIIAAGGIDEWLKLNTDDIILEYMDGLYDPFEDLDPPEPAESQINRVYSCADQADTTTADITTLVEVSYSYWQGSSEKKNVGWANEDPNENHTTSHTDYDQIVQPGTQNGTSTSTSVEWRRIGGSGSDKRFERKETTTTVTHANVTVTDGGTAGDSLPGTYSNIHVGCDTTFAPGVYVIDGGGLILNGQHEVTGAGVMFVLKNGAYVQINGGSSMSLTAMQESELVDAGISASDARDLAGMLIFEDRDSQGTNKNNINGNSATVLNGTLYFPVSELAFAGTATVTSQCLMITANTITLTGTTNMTTFCPEGSDEDTNVINTAAKVRLVA